MDINQKLSGAALEGSKPSSTYADAGGTSPVKPREPSMNTESELQKNVQFGRQILAFGADLADLARIEALLAVKSLPRLLMLWLIMMPVILLTWSSLTVLVAWGVYSLSSELGVGLFVFFLQQVLLLVACYVLYTKYKKRMTMPHTRNHLNEFLKEFSNEASDSAGNKKL